MSDFFVGRQKIGEPFEIPLTGHTKLRCQIFQHWKQKETYECTCGLSVPFKVTKTWGVSEKDTETLESAIGSSVGAKDVAQVSSKISAVTGHEVSWTYSKAQEMTYTCEAPECGSQLIRVYQLVYEYEFTGYSRPYIFKRHVWDQEWVKTIPEELASYSCTCDRKEFDDRCKGCAVKPSPEFDGRLTIDLGPLSLRVPYRVKEKNLDFRIGKYGISLHMDNFQRMVQALEGPGISIDVSRNWIDPPLLFLSGLAGETFRGTMRVYSDDVIPRHVGSFEPILQEILLEDLIPKGKGQRVTKNEEAQASS